jgi:hypothetical protein
VQVRVRGTREHRSLSEQRLEARSPVCREGGEVVRAELVENDDDDEACRLLGAGTAARSRAATMAASSLSMRECYQGTVTNRLLTLWPDDHEYRRCTCRSSASRRHLPRAAQDPQRR